jgi:hypothetical protein
MDNIKNNAILINKGIIGCEELGRQSASKSTIKCHTNCCRVPLKIEAVDSGTTSIQSQ